VVENFFQKHQQQLSPFILYGSGDFHHLSGLWLRLTTEPLVVVSFDNHPDWDVRPPKWCCGSWVNRALELPHVQKVSVWGCGNFECWWPGQAFGNRRAEREGKLGVHAWADGRSPAQQSRRGAIFRDTWRAQFESFVAEIGGRAVYVTVDLDCLRAGDAVTNWENGKFTTEDVAWAIGKLQASTRVVAGDICGAFSPQKYARLKQRFVAALDHPKLPPVDAEQAHAINRAAFEKLWPVLVNGAG
jgi:arginase family enzyme